MTVGIVVAMDKEVAPFLKGKNAKEIKYGLYTVFNFTLAGKDVYLIRQQTVGEICSAGATQILITKFNVDVVLNFGVVGALTHEISLLSTMAVSSVVHYAMDTTSFDGHEMGKYSCFDDVAIPCDEKLLEIVHEVQPDMPIVRCASADKFVDSAEEKQYLNKQFGAEICDMESAGIVITCALNNVPCLLIKSVSDSLMGGGKQYSETVLIAVEQYVSVVEKVLEKL